MTALSVCRVLVLKEFVGMLLQRTVATKLQPTYLETIEIGDRSAYSSVQCYIPLFLQALWYEHNKYIKSHRLTNRRKQGTSMPFSFFLPLQD